MTREEAIEIFRLLRCQDTRVEAGDYEQALEMAIQALSQEPKLTGICNECLKKNGCEMYSQLIKSGEKYTVESCEKYIAEPCILDRRVDENIVVFKTIDGKEVEYIRKDTCDDAISRQAGIDIIDSWLSCGDYSEAERHIMRAIQSVLYDMPSVTQKSGKWIDREEYDADRWKCSICGRTEQYQERYCPNCGAKMESEV